MTRLETTSEQSLAEVLVQFIFTLVFGICATLLGGWVFSEIWEWFIVPAGLPDIAWQTGVGVMFLFGVIASGLVISLRDDTKKSTPVANTVGMCIGYLLVWCIAWCYQYFIM